MKALRSAVKPLMLRAMMIAAFCTGGQEWANAALLYNQPANAPGGLASQNAPNAFGSLLVAFDDFTLTTGAFITDVEWFGSYSNPAVQGSISQFEITFWSNNAGLPNSALQTYDIPGSAAEQLVGSVPGFLEYSYATNLPSPFAVNANTTYWLSIQPTVGFPPQWFWRDGTGGDNRSAQINRSVSQNPSSIAEDLAFSLTGFAVPEPTSFLLVGVGLIGMAQYLRKARAQAHRISTRPIRALRKDTPCSMC